MSVISTITENYIIIFEIMGICGAEKQISARDSSFTFSMLTSVQRMQVNNQRTHTFAM